MPNIITIFFAGYVIYNISKGDNTVGDFTYYLGIMGQITTTTFGIIAAISEHGGQRREIPLHPRTDQSIQHHRRRSPPGRFLYLSLIHI